MRQPIILVFVAVAALATNAYADDAPVATPAASEPVVQPAAPAEPLVAPVAPAAPAAAPQRVVVSAHPARAASPEPRLVTVSAEDGWVLERGTIGVVPYVIGGLGSVYLGFGIGHAIQGRYGQRGWMMTLGEVGGLALVAGGFMQSCAQGCGDNAMSTLGIATFIGFKVWEVLDAWIYPPIHNSHYEEITKSLGARSFSVTLPQPVLVPATSFVMPRADAPLQLAVSF